MAASAPLAQARSTRLSARQAFFSGGTASGATADVAFQHGPKAGVCVLMRPGQAREIRGGRGVVRGGHGRAGLGVRLATFRRKDPVERARGAVSPGREAQPTWQVTMPRGSARRSRRRGAAAGHRALRGTRLGPLPWRWRCGTTGMGTCSEPTLDLQEGRAVSPSL